MHAELCTHVKAQSVSQRVYLVDLRYPAGVVEDSLGKGGLPRVDVG